MLVIRQSEANAMDKLSGKMSRNDEVRIINQMCSSEGTCWDCDNCGGSATH